MRYTPPTRFIDIRFGALLGLVTLIGCGATGELHPEFEKLRPTGVAVPPVENETTAQLVGVRFGGVLQRAVTGPHVHDVLALLRESLREELEIKGYPVALVIPPDTDFRQPLPEGGEKPGFDAVLHATVKSWSARTTHPYQAEMGYLLELYHVPTAVVLFRARVVARAGGQGRTSPGFLEDAIRRSARRGLSSLPTGG